MVLVETLNVRKTPIRSQPFRGNRPGFAMRVQVGKTPRERTQKARARLNNLRLDNCIGHIIKRARRQAVRYSVR